MPTNQLLRAIKDMLPFVCIQVIGCHGEKCREPWCSSCNGEDSAEASVLSAQLAYQRLLAAITLAEAQDGTIQ